MDSYKVGKNGVNDKYLKQQSISKFNLRENLLLLTFLQNSQKPNNIYDAFPLKNRSALKMKYYDMRRKILKCLEDGQQNIISNI